MRKDVIYIMKENEKDYRFMTVKEIADMLLKLPFGNSIDFTFDSPDDVTEDFEPSGWYGVKLNNLFDEPFGVLCFGYYGGGSGRIEEIYEKKEIVDILQRFVNEEVGMEVKDLCVSNKFNAE